ncbi:hypothetical protein BKA70DRAFT_1217461 [Coprinopsis sp. MPI-PUGE-AT-0042]|nr:hypothetical protein BKA70DRAFT_1217461 [Coprinopsis sp. MPI-PUGE-AT-0042]
MNSSDSLDQLESPDVGPRDQRAALRAGEAHRDTRIFQGCKFYRCRFVVSGQDYHHSEEHHGGSETPNNLPPLFTPSSPLGLAVIAGLVTATSVIIATCFASLLVVLYYFAV